MVILSQNHTLSLTLIHGDHHEIVLLPFPNHWSFIMHIRIWILLSVVCMIGGTSLYFMGFHLYYLDWHPEYGSAYGYVPHFFVFIGFVMQAIPVSRLVVLSFSAAAPEDLEVPW